MKRVLLSLLMLLVFGASVFSNDTFIDAAGNGNLAIIEEMLNSSININAKNHNGETALIYASQYGHTEIVKLLIDKGADVNIQNDHGYTALMYASTELKIEIIKLLIKAGADANIKTNDNEIVLNRVLGQLSGGSNNNNKNILEITKLIVASGVNLDTKDNKGYTPLLYIWYHSEGFYNGRAVGYDPTFDYILELYKILIRAGANVNAKDNNGITALIRASAYGYVEAVRFLIISGADVNVRDNRGRTALSIAAQWSRESSSSKKSDIEGMLKMAGAK